MSLCSYACCTQQNLPPIQYLYGPPLNQGDDVLGLYGLAYNQFVQPVSLPCTAVLGSKNNQSPLFYHNIQAQNQPTYGFLYKGKDYFFRAQAL